MIPRLAGDTPGAEQICQRMTALRSPVLGIQTPLKGVELNPPDVATRIQSGQRGY